MSVTDEIKITYAVIDHEFKQVGNDLDSFTLVPPTWYERILLFQETTKKIGADYHTIIAFYECPTTLIAEVGYRGIES